MAETGQERPSSPALSLTETHDESRPSRKRPHEDMNENVEDIPASSITLSRPTQDSRNDFPDASTAEPPSSTQVTAPSQHAHTIMGPPAHPASVTTQPSQQVPTSEEGSVSHPPKAAPSIPPVKMNTKHKQHNAVRESTTSSEADSPTLSQDSPPEEQIDQLDWNDLMHRYHDKMEEFNDREAEIINQFGELSDYFGLWAQVGSTEETGRTFKRLRTQITLVQRREDELEQKRQHYVQVVNAFKSALALLIK